MTSMGIDFVATSPLERLELHGIIIPTSVLIAKLTSQAPEKRDIGWFLGTLSESGESAILI